MSDNLSLYNKVREVPKEAQKPIQGGRLSGKTDINPMWRIKTLTEQFGPVGIGWKYVIRKEWLETGANGETAAFVDIDLYYKHNGEWSEAIPGTGGSSFIAKEAKGLYTDDECFKKALTDAISVSCKALGIGADIYWSEDSTKYTEKPQGSNADTSKKLSPAQVNRAFAIAKGKGYSPEEVKAWALKKYRVTEISVLTKEQYDDFCKGMEGMEAKA